MPETIFSIRNIIGKDMATTIRIGRHQDRCIMPRTLRQIIQVRIMSRELGIPTHPLKDHKDHLKARQSTMVRCRHPRDSVPKCTMDRTSSLTQGILPYKTGHHRNGSHPDGQNITYQKSGLMKARLCVDQKNSPTRAVNGRSQHPMIATPKL